MSGRIIHFYPLDYVCMFVCNDVKVHHIVVLQPLSCQMEAICCYVQIKDFVSSGNKNAFLAFFGDFFLLSLDQAKNKLMMIFVMSHPCLLYTSPSPRDRQKSRMPSSA